MKWYFNLWRGAFAGFGWRPFTCRMAILWLHTAVICLLVPIVFGVLAVFRAVVR